MSLTKFYTVPRVYIRGFYPVIKDYSDRVLGFSLLLGLTPLFLTTAILIKLTSRGPVIYKQKRLTVGNNVFTIYKFRTMYQNSESTTGAVWAKNNDPRVTFIGQYLRKYRIDELPQLVNVIRGDMSLIGPRPERPEMIGSLTKVFPSFNKRHLVKAGITGLAQTTCTYANCHRTYRKKLAHDLLYVKNRCLLLDLRIAAKTLLVVLTGSGAK
ncbi:MAG: sugar transferase [Proteobacteria bacterium]|nr:sugar transferase [Pseudomonadota bacterium]